MKLILDELFIIKKLFLSSFVMFLSLYRSAIKLFYQMKTSTFKPKAGLIVKRLNQMKLR